jgi:hypothetical protein
MKPVVWIPYEPRGLPGLPDGLDRPYRDGTDTCPTPPEEVRLLTGFPGAGGYEPLVTMVSRARRLEVLRVLSSGHDCLTPRLGLLPPGALLRTGRGVHAEATAELAVTLLLASGGGIPRARAAGGRLGPGRPPDDTRQARGRRGPEPSGPPSRGCWNPSAADSSGAPAPPGPATPGPPCTR